MELRNATSAEQNIFLGPVFIVGMPRSGTSLMRNLLNQHPRVSLSFTESHFIPHCMKVFGDPPSFKSRSDVERFIKRFHRTWFFQKTSERGITFTVDDLYQHANLESWASIFECILRRFSPNSDQIDTIWGDKTPGYINHMPLLARLYPQARFLHMIRDPRDYCLSARKSWGKSIYRAAHRWQATVTKARQIGKTLNEDYLEVTYESLLTDTEVVMKRVSAFLGCEYHPDMTQIGLSTEKRGSARGKYGIVKDNMNKYVENLSKAEIRRIEELVCNSIADLDYKVENDVRYRPLSKLELLGYKLYDGPPSFYHHIVMANSVAKGIKRFVNHYSTSSWR